MRNKQLTKDYIMRIKRTVEKEYTENDVKITRYEAVKPKNTVLKGKPRKPTFGWKEPK